jgi:hypothetical protein
VPVDMRPSTLTVRAQCASLWWWVCASLSHLCVCWCLYACAYAYLDTGVLAQVCVCVCFRLFNGGWRGWEVDPPPPHTALKGRPALHTASV